MLVATEFVVSGPSRSTNYPFRTPWDNVLPKRDTAGVVLGETHT